MPQNGPDLVFQIGTAKYGVRDEAGRLCDERLRAIGGHPQVRMFEIKLSQGAKPGKGGILPAAKVTPEIAAIRGIPVGTDSISPNRHPDIASSADLLDQIEQVRETTGKPVGFKCVDGAEGGTGAAPMPLMDDMGLPLRVSLPLVIDKLCEHGLRERVRVVASGKLVTPADVAWALCVGADFVTSARGFMFALGCIQALQCNKNTCPTGITTQDPRLQSGLHPPTKAGRVAAYASNIATEVGVIAHACGVRSPRVLRRSHAHVVQPNGLTVALDVLHPDVQPLSRAVAGTGHQPCHLQ